MTEPACYLCHDTDALVAPFDDFRFFEVECKVCGNYIIRQDRAESISKDPEVGVTGVEKRLKLQKQVKNLNPPSSGKMVVIRDTSNGLVAVLIDKSKFELESKEI